MVVFVALAQSTVLKRCQPNFMVEEEATHLLAHSSKTTSLATLVDGLGDPVDSGVTADSLVVGIHEDNFVVLVDTILVDPVRVEDSQVAASATDTLLSSRPQATLGLELVDTLSHGLAVGGTCKWKESSTPSILQTCGW